MTVAVQSQDMSQDRRRHDKYDRLVAVAQSLPKLKVAVAHPCDAASLGAVFEATDLGLIEPILVGPQARITATAAALGKDVSAMRIVDAQHSHAAAEAAVDLVRSGQAEALMKGSLHTDELMGAIVRREGGLRTARRISHCFVMDVPTHETALIITDAAVNIAPTLEDKVHIVQNAIDLARALRVDPVRVAILSAMETVNP
ncbi:phosphate acyltransferase, partial [Microvirga sesbaniae]